MKVSNDRGYNESLLRLASLHPTLGHPTPGGERRVVMWLTARTDRADLFLVEYFTVVGASHSLNLKFPHL